MVLARRDMLGLLAGFAVTPAFAQLNFEDDVDVFNGLVMAIAGTSFVHPRLKKACEYEFVKTFGLSSWLDLIAYAKRKKTLRNMQSSARQRVLDQMSFLAKLLYTGQVGDEVLYYEYALGWQALDFATAPGQCGGPFGHWSSPVL